MIIHTIYSYFLHQTFSRMGSQYKINWNTFNTLTHIPTEGVQGMWVTLSFTLSPYLIIECFVIFFLWSCLCLLFECSTSFATESFIIYLLDLVNLFNWDILKTDIGCEEINIEVQNIKKYNFVVSECQKSLILSSLWLH